MVGEVAGVALVVTVAVEGVALVVTVAVAFGRNDLQGLGGNDQQAVQPEVVEVSDDGEDGVAVDEDHEAGHDPSGQEKAKEGTAEEEGSGEEESGEREGEEEAEDSENLITHFCPNNMSAHDKK